ncbi:uncharacterized protein LOC103574395 [Microplitis demolitor]|uniref:uncharacterized protein LOC103574395 n=1 Tax=Microplitis demolitor TaxID=69319 RepID=UPI0004CCC0AB|nr:uncharacterized protein LOC103574395 [Microplitis demolitor]
MCWCRSWIVLFFIKIIKSTTVAVIMTTMIAIISAQQQQQQQDWLSLTLGNILEEILTQLELCRDRTPPPWRYHFVGNLLAEMYPDLEGTRRSGFAQLTDQGIELTPSPAFQLQSTNNNNNY